MNKIKCLFGHHPWQTGVWLRRCQICDETQVEYVYDVWKKIQKHSLKSIKIYIDNESTTVAVIAVAVAAVLIMFFWTIVKVQTHDPVQKDVIEEVTN